MNRPREFSVLYRHNGTSNILDRGQSEMGAVSGTFEVFLKDNTTGYEFSFRAKGNINEFDNTPLRNYSHLSSRNCTADDLENDVIRVITPSADSGGREYYFSFHGHEGSKVEKTEGTALAGTATVKVKF